MPQIGRLEYPEISFSNALETVESIKSKSIKTIHGLAEELGYSTKSKSPGGTFYYKLVALDKLFGLVTRDRGNLALTTLGQRIAYPLNASDRAAAIRESILRVDLIRGLHDGLGESYHESDFRPKLRELTGTAPDQIASEATRIENLYRDALQYLKGGAPSTVPGGPATDSGKAPGQLSADVAPPDERAPPQGAIASGARSGAGEIPTFGGRVRNLHSEDGYFIRIKLDVPVIEEAITMLTALRNRLAHLPPETGSTADGTPPPTE